LRTSAVRSVTHIAQIAITASQFRERQPPSGEVLIGNIGFKPTPDIHACENTMDPLN
jgi:hypothetical protein